MIRELYITRHMLVDGKFKLVKIRLYCKHGHLMKRRDEIPGRQYCKKCCKINRQNQRYWLNRKPSIKGYRVCVGKNGSIVKVPI